MDVVLDSGGLSAWAARRPPVRLVELLEVVAMSGGAVVVPSVVVTESTTGRQHDDAGVNHRLRRSLVDDCTLELARAGGVLRFEAGRGVSAVDAIVAATARRRGNAPVVTSDPDDLAALLGTGHRLLVV